MPEMVFLLGQMGDNKKALTLIIERLGDVNRVRELPTTNGPTLIICSGHRLREGAKRP